MICWYRVKWTDMVTIAAGISHAELPSAEETERLLWGATAFPLATPAQTFAQLKEAFNACNIT